MASSTSFIHPARPLLVRVFYVALTRDQARVWCRCLCSVMKIEHWYTNWRFRVHRLSSCRVVALCLPRQNSLSWKKRVMNLIAKRLAWMTRRLLRRWKLQCEACWLFGLIGFNVTRWIVTHFGDRCTRRMLIITVTFCTAFSSELCNPDRR